jgi:hypothetical protein
LQFLLRSNITATSFIGKLNLTNMVRIKERYLLVNILYPSEASKTQIPDVPDLVVLHQPTTDALTPQALGRGIRAQVVELFGDHGSGVVSAQGKFWSSDLELSGTDQLID